MKKKIRTRIIF